MVREEVLEPGLGFLEAPQAELALRDEETEVVGARAVRIELEVLPAERDALFERPGAGEGFGQREADLVDRGEIRDDP